MSEESIVERIHRLFCAGMESAKWMKRTETLLGLIAAGLAVTGILYNSSSHWCRYLPLAAVLVAIGAAFVRSRASSYRSFGEACRRLSVRSYSMGNDVPAKAASGAIDGTPFFVGWNAKRLRVLPIDKYYGASKPAGPSRLLEMYATSSYFSSRLLRLYAVILLCAAVFLGIVIFVALYCAAVELTGRPELLDAILEIIGAVVFVAVFLTVFERFADAWGASRQLRHVEEQLMDMDIEEPDLVELLTKVSDYDSEQLASPLIPTLLYQWRREKLNTGWLTRHSILYGKK